MRVKGLEPPRPKAPDPKSGASANSAKPALMTRTGLEPVTLWLKVKCSTNWANESLTFIEIFSTSTVPTGIEPAIFAVTGRRDNRYTTGPILFRIWELTGSNRWPSACKADALPAELNSQRVESSSANGEKLRFSHPPIVISISSQLQLS